MTTRPGYGSRYDRFTPNAIDAARDESRAPPPKLDYGHILCAKCQQKKPKKGCKKRGPLLVCADCSQPNKEAK